jgi:hypothetical protein
MNKVVHPRTEKPGIAEVSMDKGEQVLSIELSIGGYGRRPLFFDLKELK